MQDIMEVGNEEGGYYKSDKLDNVDGEHTLCPLRVDWHVPNPFSTPSFDPGIEDSTALFVADKSHTRSVLSREPETRLLPSGENATLSLATTNMCRRKYGVPVDTILVSFQPL